MIRGFSSPSGSFMVWGWDLLKGDKCQMCQSVAEDLGLPEQSPAVVGVAVEGDGCIVSVTGVLMWVWLKGVVC